MLGLNRDNAGMWDYVVRHHDSLDMLEITLKMNKRRVRVDGRKPSKLKIAIDESQTCLIQPYDAYSQTQSARHTSTAHNNVEVFMLFIIQ